MRSFFDYCYYRIAKFHSRWFSEEPEDTAKYLVWILHSFNIISLISILFLIAKWTMTSVYLVIIMVVVFIIDSKFFYNKKRYLELCERWDDEDKKRRRIKGWGVVLYILFTIVFFAVISIILHKQGLLVANLSYGIDWGKIFNK